MSNRNTLQDIDHTGHAEYAIYGSNVPHGPGTADPGNIYKKLSLRNRKRSVKDYLVYMLTMVFVTALMYAFNSLILQNHLLYV